MAQAPQGTQETTLPVLGGPGVKGVPQPSPEDKAKIEAGWIKQRDESLNATLADIILIINAHPELIEWARQSKAGVLRAHDK